MSACLLSTYLIHCSSPRGSPDQIHLIVLHLSDLAFFPSTLKATNDDRGTISPQVQDAVVVVSLFGEQVVLEGNIEKGIRGSGLVDQKRFFSNTVGDMTQSRVDSAQPASETELTR